MSPASKGASHRCEPSTVPSAADVSQTISPAEKRYGRPIAAFFALAWVNPGHRSEILVLRPTDTDPGGAPIDHPV